MIIPLAAGGLSPLVAPTLVTAATYVLHPVVFSLVMLRLPAGEGWRARTIGPKNRAVVERW